MAKLWKKSRISRGVQRELYERIVIPIAVYGSEKWSLSAQERIKIEVFGMLGSRNICGIR